MEWQLLHRRWQVRYMTGEAMLWMLSVYARLLAESRYSLTDS